MATTLDTLEIAKRLKSAGFGDDQAEAITSVLRETRDADLSRVATREEMNAGFVALRTEINAGFAALRAEMEILRRDLTIRLGGMLVVATGVLLAAKFFG